MRPTVARRGCGYVVILFAVVIAAAVFVFVSLGDLELSPVAEQAPFDVELLGCSSVRVTNSSSDRVNYIVEIGFDGADPTSAPAPSTILVRGLASGEQVTRGILPVGAAPVTGCRIVAATRIPDRS